MTGSDTEDSTSTQRSFSAIKRQAAKIAGQIDETVREAATESYVLETEEYFAEKVNKLALKNQRRRDDNELRKEYAKKAYFLACCSVWIWAVLFIAVAIANGASGKPLLSDRALVTLTAGATVNVLAAFLAIVRGLFPHKK